MNSNLFKSAEFYRRRYHNFATLLIVPFALLVLFLAVFSLYAQKEITVQAVGEITPTKVIASIQSTSNNTVIQNHLKENLPVSKGDLLLQYSETMEDSQKQALEKQLEIYQQQEEGLKTLKDSLQQGKSLFSQADEFGYSTTFEHFVNQSNDITADINKANTEVNNQKALAENTLTAVNEQIQSLNQQITYYQELKTAISNQQSVLSDGNPYKSMLDSYLQQYNQQPDPSITNQYLTQIDNAISSIQSSLSNLEIQKSSTGTASAYDNSLTTKIEVLRSQYLQETEQQLTELQLKLTDLKSQIELADIQLKENQLLAPETGVLHLAKGYTEKKLLAKGTEIAAIYPDISKTKEVFITYYLPSDNIGQIKKDQTVHMKLEKIGKHSAAITGKVHEIDSTATQTKEGNLFKVTAVVKLSKKESQTFRYGLQGRVTSVISQKTYFNYYKDKFFHDLD